MTVDLVSVGLTCADVGARPIDEYPEAGKLSLVPHLEIHMGGLAGVTATVFSQLGGKAAFIGKVGTDGFGDYLLGAMRAAGVNVDGVQRVPGEGSSATIVLISGDGERTFLHHTGATTQLTEDDVDFGLVSQAKALHWGGPAVTPGLDGEPIGRVMRRAREAGVKTSMDTCYDGSGVWFPRLEHALPHLDIVMSSLEEAREYTGKRTPEDIASFYRSFGPEVAVIKLGGDGIYVQGADEEHRLPAHRVKVVDTTGAGDASCAGFLYGYLQGWDLLRCARLANAVGALTVQNMGGAEAIVSLEETLAFMEAG
ncbi:MAG: carbohydrate kinase family protein [Candidatus Hydrogenedentes bacterium]|nr:carbohydrate kinase family protein [Candidatus Hydrogenedentota bacterium]